MFKVFIIVIGMLMTSISFAQLCDHQTGKLVCPSDKIVHKTYGIGIVTGYNPDNQMVSFKYTDGDPYSSDYRRTFMTHDNLSEIAITYGCLQGRCVGDTVVSSKTNNEGEVIGINLFKKTVSYLYTDLDPYSSNYRRKFISTEPVSNIASSKFCVDYTEAQRALESFPSLRNK